MEASHDFFMKQAIELSERAIENGGAPFGAVVVCPSLSSVWREQIVGEGYNTVNINKDPTLHGEVVAIKQACKKLDTCDLSNCVIYSSCEPCPMCTAVIYYSKIRTVFYGARLKNCLRHFDLRELFNEIGAAKLGHRSNEYHRMQQHSVPAEQVIEKWATLSSNDPLLAQMSPQSKL